MNSKEELLEKVKEMFPNGHPNFYKKMVDFCDLHNRKNRDYATNDDPMRNFRSVGELCDKYDIWNWEVGSEMKVAIIYMLKQFDAYMNLLKEHREGGIEGVSDRIGDVVVYHIIADILYKES